MKNTKIVATIGPASESKETLRELVKARMNVARLNFSHGEHAWHRTAIDRIREVSEELGVPVGILADLQGPRIRIGNEEEFGVTVGQTVRISDVSRKDTLPASKHPTILLDVNGIIDSLEEGHEVLVQEWNDTFLGGGTGRSFRYCESGNGFDYGQTNADIGTSNYNGSLNSSYGCYGYDSAVGNDNSQCTFGSSMLSSNGSTKEYFEMKQGVGGTNANGDSEYNTIWRKLYTWDQALGIYSDTNGNGVIEANEQGNDGACPTGRHVPTDTEWTTLENTLAGTTCRTGNGRQCDGNGWRTNTSYTPDRRLADTLKIPLAGFRNSDGSTFHDRGHDTYLWSSTPGGSSAYGRGLNRNSSTVHRSNNTQSNG